MYVTSRGAPRTGLPFVLPVSFDKIDNNNNNTQIQLQSGPCLPLRHARACSLLIITKRGIPVIYRYNYSYIASTYVRIVCVISFLQMLATNTSDIAT